MEDSHPDFITVINSILLLIDYQTNNLNYVESGDRTEIIEAVAACAKAASILSVPVVLTTMNYRENGNLISELEDIFPGKKVIERLPQHSDAFGDEKIMEIIKKSGRKKLLISGLITSRSYCDTAIRGIDEGYDVFGLIDACGDITHDRHNSGMQRMLKAGVTPITWMSLTSELMNGWANPPDRDLPDEIFDKYNVMLSHLSKH